VMGDPFRLRQNTDGLGPNSKKFTPFTHSL
jgi:hypothetical protein